MTDRELLELAAKAVGLSNAEWKEYTNAPPTMVVRYEPPVGGITGHDWNPLSDDGDALRLACQLQFDLVLGHRGATVTLPGKKPIEELCHQDSGENLACTRRAIVRAAAEIGRAMK